MSAGFELEPPRADRPLAESAESTESVESATAPRASSCGCASAAASSEKESAPAAAMIAWVRLILAAFLAGNSMLFTLAVNLSEMAPAERFTGQLVLLGVTLLVVALVGVDLVRGSIAAIRSARWPFEALFVLGISGAFGYSLVSMARGEGAIYFEVVSILLVIYALGGRIKRASQARVLRAAAEWSPELNVCQVLDASGRLVPRAVSALRPGERVRVFPGQMIPVDGRVEEGASFVREAAMTGESALVPRHAGDAVLAGTHALDGTLTIRAEAAGDARRIDAIVRAVEAAQARPSRFERAADRVARGFFPFVALATLATFLGFAPSLGWSDALVRALAVLVVACPCALGFATPVAVATALARLGRRGLVAREGEAIERLAHVDAVVFDKTGTLTDAEEATARLTPAAGAALPLAEIAALIAAAERGSDHPLARPLARLAEGAPAELVDAFTPERVEALPARGLAAVVRDARDRTLREVRIESVGSEARRAVVDDAPASAPTSARTSGQGSARAPSAASPALEAHLAVRVDGHLVARVDVGEELLPGVGATMDELERAGYAVSVLSGDRAERLARLGLGRAEGSLGPEDKLARVEALQREGRAVLFVGDGVNDAAALAAADVGIAVSEGSALAGESAHLAWHGRDPQALVEALAIARQTVSVLRGNLVYASVYNVVGMGAAAAGYLHPVFAALLMLVSSLFVSARAARWLED